MLQGHRRREENTTAGMFLLFVPCCPVPVCLPGQQHQPVLSLSFKEKRTSCPPSKNSHPSNKVGVGAVGSLRWEREVGVGWGEWEQTFYTCLGMNSPNLNHHLSCPVLSWEEKEKKNEGENRGWGGKSRRVGWEGKVGSPRPQPSTSTTTPIPPTAHHPPAKVFSGKGGRERRGVPLFLSFCKVSFIVSLPLL